jgi:hypothetical protein
LYVEENGMPGGWIAVFVLCLLLAATLFGVYEGWTAHSGGIEVPVWGYAFLGVGIVLGAADRLRLDGACFLQQPARLR